MGHAVRPWGLGSVMFGIPIKLHIPSLALSTILWPSTMLVELTMVGIKLTTALLMLASIITSTSVLIWAFIGTTTMHTHILYCIPITKSRTAITLPVSVIRLKAIIIMSVTGKWDKIMSPISSTRLSKYFWRWNWAFLVSAVLLKWFTRKWDKIMSPTSSTRLSKCFWRWHWAFLVSVVLLKWFTLETTWFVIFMGTGI